MEQQHAQKPLRFVIGIVLAAAFLWLTLRQVSVRAIVSAFEHADPWRIAIGLTAVVVGYSCRVARWHLMLTCSNRELRWRDCAGPLLASFAVNNILPFRAGDVMRSFAFNSRLGTTSGVVLATVFVERVLDLSILLGMLGIALACFKVTSVVLAAASNAFLLAAAGGLLLVRFPVMWSPIAHGLARLTALLLPRFDRTIVDEVQRGMATARLLARRGRMMVLILWSTAAWLAEGCAYWAAASSLPTLGRPEAAWLALPVGALATLLPSTPGYFGTFHYFTAQAMTLLGDEISSATVYAFLIHAMIWLPPTLSGCVYLLLRPAGRRIRG